MSGTYLNLTNTTLARLNEVQLTSSNFSNARGIQVQAQNAVNEFKKLNLPITNISRIDKLIWLTFKTNQSIILLYWVNYVYRI